MTTFNHPISQHQGHLTPNAQFSILIPTWNNLELLKLCIQSIQKNSFFQHEIIVHVNQGHDGSLEWVQQQGFSYTHSFENVGVCYAMNAIAALASTDYLLYMNDDMYVCPDWDKHLMAAVEQQSDHLFYLSSTMIEPKGNKQGYAIRPFDFGTSPEHFREAELLAFAKTCARSDWCGASWPPSLVHKTLWQAVGGYSVEYSPGFGSDPDFSMKLWQAGVRNFKGIGNSLVYHFQSKSTQRVVPNNGRKTFAKKWGVPSSYFYRNVLRLGQGDDGKPLSLDKNMVYRWAQVRAWWM